MEINRSRKDELSYELVVRGIDVKPSNTTDELRSYLRPLLKLEKLNQTLRYPAYNLKDAAKLKSEHLVKLLTFADLLDTPPSPNVDISTDFQFQSIDDSDSGSGALENSTAHDLDRSTSSRNNLLLIRKWNLKFTGDLKDITRYLNNSDVILMSDKFDNRRQRENEEFECYSSDIRSKASTLNLTYPEDYLISIIWARCNKQTFDVIKFFPQPTSLKIEATTRRNKYYEDIPLLGINILFDNEDIPSASSRGPSCNKDYCRYFRTI
ncbi:hypothetical protein FQA39_LY06031 [Lamprigera yunnana]|nr:hypothetical protein FQA39_LY06031 [Lamprigera yunnana]